MNILEMLNLAITLIVEMSKPFVIGILVAIGIQFIVYRVFKFSIFNAVLKAALKEIDK